MMYEDVLEKYGLIEGEVSEEINIIFSLVRKSMIENPDSVGIIHELIEVFKGYDDRKKDSFLIGSILLAMNYASQCILYDISEQERAVQEMEEMKEKNNKLN